MAFQSAACSSSSSPILSWSHTYSGKMQYHLPMIPLFWVIIFIHMIPTSLCQNQTYQVCGQAYRCGSINFTYPFWSGTNRPEYCGYSGFEVSCQSDNIPRITVSNTTYRFLRSPDTRAQTLNVARDDLYSDSCAVNSNDAVGDTVFNSTMFNYTNTQNLSLSYSCTHVPPPLPQPLNEFNCTINGVLTSNYFVLSNALRSIPPVLTSCARNITVPISLNISVQGLVGEGALKNALASGFTLGYKANNTSCERCSRSGGRCGYNTTSHSFVCYCHDGVYTLECNSSVTPSEYPSSEGVSFMIGLSTGTVLLLMVCVMICFLGKRYAFLEVIINWRSDKESNQLVEKFMRSYGSTVPKLYTYREIRKMTNSFSEKLGRGGYGCVYKGKLPDGREVAVKVLNDDKGGGEDFINEVAAISKTSHVNVVDLLGFCFNRKNRALIYQFMPNGSLDKFTCQKGSRNLEWKSLYEIAVGIARGLEYLHGGCNTRIVHLDIKPQNILLDADFRPKISDFGLAKLCRSKCSILSTMGVRGTVGYIAPELFFPSYGGISHKSDVYSYGMVVLQMVGLTRKLEIHSQETSEAYFPDWIYDHLEVGKEIPLELVTNEEERETAMKMICVGLWCIQTNPCDRPSITKAMEMLEASFQSLRFPPKPSLTSPAAMNVDNLNYSTTLTSRGVTRS